MNQQNLTHARAQSPLAPHPKREGEGAGSGLISYRDARAWCDLATLGRVLEHGRHYQTSGRRPEPYWLAEDLEELLELVALESSGGAG